jgi:hypothetical protein
MNKLRKWEKIAMILLLTASLVCLVMGFQSFHSAKTYTSKANEAMARALESEDDFLNEISRQVAYQESHPEDTTLLHVDFLSIVVKEQRNFINQQEVSIYRSAAGADFAKAVFLLAIVGWLGAVTSWLYAFKKR